MPQMMPSSWLMIYLFSIITFLFLMSSWSTYYCVHLDFSNKDFNQSEMKFW